MNIYLKDLKNANNDVTLARTDFLNNEDWAVLSTDTNCILVRIVTSGINNGLICARDCTEETNLKIKQIVLGL